MKLSFEDDVFICHSSYDERFIPKEARFRWNPHKKKWWTDDPEKALRLVKYADEPTIQRLESIKEDRQKALEQSRATDADIEIPAPDELQYLPFQMAGISYAIQRKNTFFGDEMGLGKSCQAIGTCLILNTFPLLIVCPASLKLNWRNEIRKWAPALRALIVNGRYSDGKDLRSMWKKVQDKEIEATSLQSAMRWRSDIEAMQGKTRNKEAESDESLRVVRNEVFKPAKPNERSEVLRRIMPREMEDGNATAPHDNSRGAKEGRRKTEKTALSGNERGQWQAPPCATTGTGLGFGAGMDNENRNELERTPIQTGHCRTGKENQCGSRRTISLQQERDRRKEGSTVGNGRMESDQSFKQGDTFRPAWPDGPHVIIINYDILESWISQLDKMKFQCAIADEIHFCKNFKTIRAKATHKVAKSIPHFLALSGTPILNRPAELITPLRILGVFNTLFGNWKSFVTKYCAAFQGRFGWDTTGASNLEELQDRLRSTIMVRRLKKDVLTELPAKRRQIIELPWNGAEQILEKERIGWQEANHRLEELQIAAEIAKASDDPEVYREAVQALKREAVVAFSTMSKLRHDTAVAKIPQAIEHLKDAIEASGKVICFVHHHDVVDALKDHFGDQAVVLTGRTKNEDRQAAVDRFQNDPGCTLFIGSIQAAGVGITLTAASHVVFCELDWVPGNMCQAEDRAHRIGQQESVLIQHLVFDGSLDANMAKTLVHKQAIIEKALDLETEKDEETEDRDMILAESVVSDEVKRSAARSAKRADLDAEAARLTEDQIKAIHAALVRLAQMCDGAMALDGMGFNRIDTAIGHDLAYRVFLTPRQAALGKKIVQKYRGQLGEDMMEAIGG